MPSLILLIIIYIAFISLGLPDSVFGVAWPIMRSGLKAPLEAAGLIAIFLTACSATASFLSVKIKGKFKTGPIIFFSTLLTVLGLIGYSISPSYLYLLLAAIPLGFGQGGIDSTLNGYVASHYSSRHMNWLHAFWGVGATIGPLIMTGMLATHYQWRSGYIVIASIQGILALIFLLSLRMWNHGPTHLSSIHDNETKAPSGKVRINGMRHLEPWLQISMYAIYTAIECCVGIWTTSLLIESRHISSNIAGFWVSLYFAGITIGRILTGFIADHLGNRFMVRFGLTISLIGAGLLWIHSNHLFALLGLLLLGLGFSPVYPCLMHETPRRFDHKTYHKVIAYQVGAASIGASVIPALVGLLASATTLEVLAPCVGGCIVLLLIMNARLNKTS